MNRRHVAATLSSTIEPSHSSNATPQRRCSLTPRYEYLSGTVDAITDDQRQGQLFPKEALPGQGVSAKRYDDSVQEFAPLVVADPPADGEAA